jgi:anti-anti-sigma factor
MNFDIASLLRVDVHHDATAATTRVSLHGDLDAVTADRVRQALVEVLRLYRPGRIDMDARDLAFLDSAGIRSLLLCQADAQRIGCRIVLVDPPRPIFRVLEITGLLEYFGLTDPGNALAPYG